MKAAGILPIFHDGKSVLLGKEYRERYNRSFYMEFGGKQDEGETLAQTAYREFKEETAFSVPLNIEEVERADELGHYIDHKGPRFFYRMYFIHFTTLVDTHDMMLTAQTINDQHTEKTKYKMFDLQTVLNQKDEKHLYPTLVERLSLLKTSPVFAKFLN